MKRLFILIVAFLIAGTAGMPDAQETADTAVTVGQAVFCTGVEDREPVGSADTFSTDVKRLYFWTELDVPAPPDSVTHVWYYEDTKMLETDLEAGYERTRTWSYKTILPDWVGTWRVEVVAGDGTVLERVTCTVGE